VICYGIGRISEFRHAQYQLALLVLVIQRNSFGYFNSKIFEFYDPIMNIVELKVTKHFGGIEIQKNEEGKRKVDKPSLFYMPHCGKALYNNVLWANWRLENLKNVILIGNSLGAYLNQANCTKSKLEDHNNSDLVIKTVIDRKALIELEFSINFSVAGAFNDMSIHIVKSESEIFCSAPEEYIANGNSDSIIPKF
jgi:hypothetical protein